MTHIGMDFDGTLVVWMPDVKPDYTSGQEIFYKTAAVFSTIHWTKQQLESGHSICIITGRLPYHAPWIRLWCQTFLGFVPSIHCRPMSTGVSCMSQAVWKAGAIEDERAEIYVGDNEDIDKIAARIAGIRFIQAPCLNRHDPGPVH